MAANLQGLPGHVHVAPTVHDLHDELAGVMMGIAMRAVVDRGVFHVALSGGSTPEPFYVNLVVDPRFRAIPWQQTHVWIVDERRVDEDDPRSNFRMIKQSLIDHLPMRRRQIHPMPVLLEDPASAYEAELRTVFFPGDPPPPIHALYDRLPRMDFVLLGMGDDAHTASLFPNSEAINERERWIAVNQGPNVTPPARVTMTYPLINAARQIAVLVTGAKKHATLKRISQVVSLRGADPQMMPVTGVAPMDGALAWYLDAAAAGELDEPGIELASPG
jgi:6-phosphogluconolactonase